MSRGLGTRQTDPQARTRPGRQGVGGLESNFEGLPRGTDSAHGDADEDPHQQLRDPGLHPRGTRVEAGQPGARAWPALRRRPRLRHPDQPRALGPTPRADAKREHRCRCRPGELFRRQAAGRTPIRAADRSQGFDRRDQGECHGRFAAAVRRRNTADFGTQPCYQRIRPSDLRATGKDPPV